MAGRKAKTKEELNAEMTRNPSRFAPSMNVKSTRVEMLGDPPQYLQLQEASCWEQYRKEMPWLRASDATIVEMASKLRAKLISNDLDVKEFAALRSLVVQLNGTTLSRERMPLVKDDEEKDSDGMFD